MKEIKDVPPVELSLKYMAWSVKELNMSVTKIKDLFERYITIVEEANSKKNNTPYVKKEESSSILF